MTALPHLIEQDELQHLTEEEYRVLLGISDGRITHDIKGYRRFKRHFADLREWSEAPLPTRVGLQGTRGIHRVSAAARVYLNFLVYSGKLHMDWPWIFAVRTHVLPDDRIPQELIDLIAAFHTTAKKLGYQAPAFQRKVPRILKRLYLHFGMHEVLPLSERHISNFEAGMLSFSKHPDLRLFYPDENTWVRAQEEFRHNIFHVRHLMYHMNLIAERPRHAAGNKGAVLPETPMYELLGRYLRAREAQRASRQTVQKYKSSVSRLIKWLEGNHPEITNFQDLRRDHVLNYSAALDVMISPITLRPVSIETKISLLSDLSIFFQDTTSWGWENAPTRPLIGARDLPKRPKFIPRFIPQDQLHRVMQEVKELNCPFQRTALLIARWSGARRGEIQQLDLDCMDAYPDGTPRLRIPAQKSKKERMVPLHPDAAAAIRELQPLAQNIRGVKHDITGIESARLFARKGRLITASYLFEEPLKSICAKLNLLDIDGTPLITAHRFRHTVGTELAEGGARLHTIMKILGHTSTEMTLVYAHVGDRAVVEDYQRVLGPGAVITGGLIADALRSGALPQETINWLKTNFFKTELELGHCLRLPEEGPCECDLYLNCAKFVTTREYLPRLEARREREVELAEDAQQRGWPREVERHQCAIRRIDHFIKELKTSSE